MTKEHIIEIVNACVQYNANQGTWSIDNKFADELLALFKQELLERLEKLHTEMDERMREEVAIEKRMGEKKAENLLNQIEELTIGKCALRCPLVELEKKEVAKDILSKMQYALENPEASKDLAVYTLRLIAKEYGVEL